MNCPRTIANSYETGTHHIRKTPSRKIRFGLVASTLVCLIPISLSSAASFRRIGDLPGGIFYSEAWGVSADGCTVVGLSESASGTEAFRWTAEGGMVGLGDLPGGDFYSRARGVSGHGEIVVGESSYALYEGGDIRQAFRWVDLNGNGLVDPDEKLDNHPEFGMGFLPGAEWDSTALAISSDGSTIVGKSWSALGQEGFRSTAATIQAIDGLGDLPGGPVHSSANSVSRDGAVVGGRGCTTAGHQAYRWTAGRMEALGVLPGAANHSSKTLAVSADGSVVVGGSQGPIDGSYEAFRWVDLNGNGLVDPDETLDHHPEFGLGDLPGGRLWSLANAVSGDGSVVVGYGESERGYEAFIWDQDNGMRSLKKVLEDCGVDLGGRNLRDATAISPDGLTIVGYGGNPDGNVEAWIAVLTCNHAPVCLCQNVHKSAGEDCQAVVIPEEVDAGSYDPDGDPVAMSLDPPRPYPLGDTLVTLTVTDDTGEFCQCTATITVEDTTPPEITCPDPTWVEAQGPDGAPVTDPEIQAFLNGASATDNCDLSPGIAHDAPANLPVFPLEPGGQTTTVTFTATDVQGNSSSCTSEVTVQDTTPPEITINAPQPYGLYAVGDLALDFSADDMVSGSIGPPALSATLTEGDGQPITVSPGFEPGVGVYDLVVSAVDESGNESSEAVSFVVYDPEGGFVTGGGWIDSPEGAYKPDPSLTGRATFGFVSRYERGATEPTGRTRFMFRTAELSFYSSSYDWLVVTGSNYARFKGTGAVNGYGGYRFMIWAGDSPDTFRIRIWEEDAAGVETTAYDNGFDQAIGAGSIVIHTQ